MTALKPILVAALLCAAIPGANAAFEPKNVPPFNGVDLECAITKTSDGYKKDADPIYKIVVALSFRGRSSDQHDSHTRFRRGQKLHT
jgi:hypothetical protein